MPESSNHTDSPIDEVRRAFADPAFTAAKNGGAPSFMLLGSDLRIGWANQAAATLFNAADYDTLDRRLLNAGVGAVHRLNGLLSSLKTGATPRLERLRFAWGTRIRTFTALCARTDNDGGDAIFGLAMLGSEADSIGRILPWAQQFVEQSAMPSSPSPEHPDLTAQTRALPIGEPDRVVAASAFDGRQGYAALRSALGDTDLGRFAWRTDADGTLVQADEVLLDRLGLPIRPSPACEFADQVATFDPPAAHRLRIALANRVTWNGIETLCPVHGGATTLPIVLAGSPQFDSARRFTGFRGFGKVDLSLLRAFAPVTEAEPTIPQKSDASLGLIEASVTPRPNGEVVIEAPLPVSEPVTQADSMEGFASGYNRAANVVHLWPIHAPSASRISPLVGKSPVVEDATVPAVRPPFFQANVVDGDQRSSIEAAVGRSLERKGALTSSEHQAFQEIGKALGSGPRRPSSATDQDMVSNASGSVRALDTDLARHAAALVEHMSVGLLVVRQKRVLFANEALREALRFESHSEMIDRLALYVARAEQLDARPQDIVVLPSAYGEDVLFSSASRIMVWDGQPATLWMLSAIDTARPIAVSLPPTSPSKGSSIQREGPDLASVLDACGEAVAVVDHGGSVIRLNHLAEQYFGRTTGEGRGEDFAMLLASESRAAARALLDQLNADRNIRAQVRGECVGRASDASSRVLEMRIIRLDPDYSTVVWRDLSAQRDLERDLVQARRQATRIGDQQPDFLANVSHQIRTPLNAILGFAEIMMDERFGPLGNPRYKDYLKDVHASGTQVISMIDDLLDLSRIETGRLDLSLGAVDINKIIVDCVADAHALAHRERVIVRTSFGARLPPVLADERSARQIIGNLLSNAIKFNEPGGQVIVSTASNEASAVVVRIRDTGIGMSDKDIAAALEPFRQLAPTKNATGTGLGLPLTKALVGANGASLSMRSRPSEGTMVEVTFQATSAVPNRVPA